LLNDFSKKLAARKQESGDKVKDAGPGLGRGVRRQTGRERFSGQQGGTLTSGTLLPVHQGDRGEFSRSTRAGPQRARETVLPVHHKAKATIRRQGDGSPGTSLQAPGKPTPCHQKEG